MPCKGSANRAKYKEKSHFSFHFRAKGKRLRLLSDGLAVFQELVLIVDDDMRSVQFGVGIGVDWQVYKCLGVSADLNWGLTGIFPSDFKTVEQTLYPVYGTIGVFYRLK